MNKEQSFVAGDWGTSHLRLFLCSDTGAVLDSATGPGAAQCSGRFDAVFDSLLARWSTGGAEPDAVLCGMVGSSIGWIQAPYVACPVRPEGIAGAAATLRDGRVRIVPGLSCRNYHNAPDFMRGEETQILGALDLQPALRHGRRLLCLPGTHTKWVVLEDGTVTGFLTAPTGELFALLRDHSILVRSGKQARDAIAMEAFHSGVAQLRRFPEAQLLHRLFECRSRVLSGELAPDSAGWFASGLLIASDISGALQMFPSSTVDLVGETHLLELYAAALAGQRCETTRTDGGAAAIAGLVRVRKQLIHGSVSNER
jgi:2-dehydro-3-deoxygalactonokinase